MKHVFVAIVLFVALLFLNMPKIALAQGTTAPETTITSGPSGTVDSTTASFEFSSDKSVAKFECKLDEPPGAFEDCTSPKEYNELSEGSHIFEVKATDTAGNTDPTPASRTWTVSVTDTTPPDTTITSGPSGTVDIITGKFEFSSDKSDATFECKLDDGAFEDCTSPKEYNELSEGSHIFEVKATDTAGNTDPTPASRTWTIDTTGTGDLALPDVLTWLFADPIDWKTGLALLLGGLIAALATAYTGDREIQLSRASSNSIKEKTDRHNAAVEARKKAEDSGKDVNYLRQDENDRYKDLDGTRKLANLRAIVSYTLLGTGTAVVFAGDFWQAALIGAGGPAFFEAMKQRGQLSEKNKELETLAQQKTDALNDAKELAEAQGKTEDALQKIQEVLPTISERIDPKKTPAEVTDGLTKVQNLVDGAASDVKGTVK